MLNVLESNLTPDLILLDTILLEMDGVEICKTLKSKSHTRKIPVIFLTSQSKVEEELSVLEAGAVDYIVRTTQSQILLSRISIHVKTKHMQDLLRDQREWFHRIVESAPDALLVTDDKGDIVLCNSQATIIFNYGSSELYFKNINDLIDNETGKCKDGSEFPVEISYNTLPNLNDGGSCVCIFVRDITERQRLNGEIVAAKEFAEKANQMKSNFLANVSHELRTPLNAIIGYSEILLEDSQEMGLNELACDLQKIHRSGKHLLTLINDILDLSKIEAGKMNICIEDIDLKYLLHEVAIIIQPTMEKNNNQFLMETENLVIKIMRTDAMKLKQILLNLLCNAAKFTFQGVIVLNVSDYICNNEERFKFSIRDTGIGLTDEQIKILFTSFTQVDTSTTRKYGGTGLGLALSQRLCEMMAGYITVTSAIHEGSTFVVDLPQYQAA